MTRLWQGHRNPIVRASLLGLLALTIGCGDDDNNGGGGTRFTATKLISNVAGDAPVTDPHLANAWGVARTATGPWWVANNHTGTSTVYDGNGTPFPAAGPLVVTIPPPEGSLIGAQGAQPASWSTAALIRWRRHAGGLLFDTEDGTIAGWNLDSGTVAEITNDDRRRGDLQGPAIGTDGGANRIYATNSTRARWTSTTATSRTSTAAGSPILTFRPLRALRHQNIGGSIYGPTPSRTRTRKTTCRQRQRLVDVSTAPATC